MAKMDLDRELCVCNSVTLGEAVSCMKAHACSDVETTVDLCEIGNKCESCREEGYENDGFSIAMVLSLLKQGKL